MTIQKLKSKLKTNPKSISFSETMQVIDTYYTFAPTVFTNGEVINEAGQNSGSCKLFAFAKANGFSKKETLACFGQFYFEDVLKDPDGTGHQNIRNFMKTGFDGLSFEAEPLKKK